MSSSDFWRELKKEGWGISSECDVGCRFVVVDLVLDRRRSKQSAPIKTFNFDTFFQKPTFSDWVFRPFIKKRESAKWDFLIYKRDSLKMKNPRSPSLNIHQVNWRVYDLNYDLAIFLQKSKKKTVKICKIVIFYDLLR